MTLVFIDSFDHYATADILTKYSTIFSDPEIGAYGRNGTNGMRNDATDSFVVSIPASQTYIWGIAFKVTVVVTQDEPFFYILDDASAQCSVWLNAAGGIEFRRGTTTDLAVSDPGVIPTDQWLFMEISLTVDNSAGAFELKLDETTIFSDSSVDTQTTANAYLNGLRPIGSVNYVQWDDFYVLNTSGSAPQNTFLGDVRASFSPQGQEIRCNGKSQEQQIIGMQ
jgi:hypothetical protein